MSSTRTKNTPGNYELEQWVNNKTVSHNTYVHKGIPTQTHLPGNGLLAGRVHMSQLSNNSCDIESLLFGIGSTNLVNPQTPIQPEIKYLQSLNISDKIPLLMPSSLTIQPNQRPLMD